MGLVTVEVRDVVSELMLSPEFEAEQLPISKELPQQCFGRCLSLSQFARKGYQTSKVISATVLPSFIHVRTLFPLPRESTSQEEGICAETSRSKWKATRLP